MSNNKKTVFSVKYLRNGFVFIIFELPFVFIGGPRSLGDILIVRTSLFFAEPENKQKLFY